jgi:type I restriction enzyme S subunit
MTDAMTTTFPERWQLLRAKYIFRRVYRPAREQDQIVTAFRDGAVTARVNRRLDGFTESLKEIGYQGVRKTSRMNISVMD